MKRISHKNNREIRPIIVHKSIAVFILRVILLELVFEAIYLTWRTGIHYLPFSFETIVTLNTVSLIFFLVLVTIIQNIFLIYIALVWTNDYYEFRVKDIAHYTGIVGKTKQSYQYRDIQSITIRQSVLGRLLHYGNVILYIPTLGHDVHFNEISDPKSFVEELKSRQPDIAGARYIIKR